MGRVGLEPTLYLTSRIYSPLPSPIWIPTRIGAAERTRTSRAGGHPAHPRSRRADYQLSHCCIYPHRKPSLPGEHVTDVLLATGVGFEPTAPFGSIGFRDRLATSYRTLPYGEEGETRTPTPHTGRDGLAIRCLTIGLTPPFDYKEYSLVDPPQVVPVDQRRTVYSFHLTRRGGQGRKNGWGRYAPPQPLKIHKCVRRGICLIRETPNLLCHKNYRRLRKKGQQNRRS